MNSRITGCVVASVETVLYFLHSSVFLSMSRPLFTKQMFYYVNATKFNAKIHTGQPVMYYFTNYYYSSTLVYLPQFIFFLKN